MKILGAIIAGGASTRMGREKALLEIDGVPLIERVASRLRLQANGLIINANGERRRFAHLGIPVVPDLVDDVTTPLAGIHASLRYGRDHGFAAVVTVPTDVPFLPLDLVPRLLEAGEEKGAAICASDGQSHYLTGIWTTALLPALEQRLEHDGLRRVQDFVSLTQAEQVEWPTTPHDPFFNINTPDDLALAERIARGDA